VGHIPASARMGARWRSHIRFPSCNNIALAAVGTILYIKALDLGAQPCYPRQKTVGRQIIDLWIKLTTGLAASRGFGVFSAVPINSHRYIQRTKSRLDGSSSSGLSSLVTSLSG
jgi:hypothetical protein